MSVLKTILWRIIRILPGIRVMYQTRETLNPIRPSHLLRKLFCKNKKIYWPIHPNSYVLHPENIYAGIDTSPGYSPGCYIQGGGKIYIGDYTQIAPNVGIISSNHDIYDIHMHLPSKVRIGKYCWIGMNSVILPGVTLGDFTVVGAGSIVTKSFPEGACVIAGNPASKIKNLAVEKLQQRKNKIEYNGFIPNEKFDVFL